MKDSKLLYLMLASAVVNVLFWVSVICAIYNLAPLSKGSGARLQKWFMEEDPTKQERP